MDFFLGLLNLLKQFIDSRITCYLFVDLLCLELKHTLKYIVLSIKSNRFVNNTFHLKKI